MFARYFLIFTAVLMVSACSGSADKGAVDTSMDPSVADGAFVQGENTFDDGPAPGTQADLVVNVGDRVFFETDSSSLTSSARTTLENQAQLVGSVSIFECEH